MHVHGRQAAFRRLLDARRRQRYGVDRSTNLLVYARVADKVDEFFGRLKAVLKEIGRQEEILIERADVWLTPSATAARKR